MTSLFLPTGKPNEVKIDWDALDLDKTMLRHDHRYEAGAYKVCRRCGDSYENHVASGTAR